MHVVRLSLVVVGLLAVAASAFAGGSITLITPDPDASTPEQYDPGAEGGLMWSGPSKSELTMIPVDWTLG